MSDDDRAREGAVHRRRPQAFPIVTTSEDDTSPHQTDEERLEIRRRRGPSERLEHLEIKVSAIDAKHDANHLATSVAIGRIDGKLSTLVDLATKSSEERERRALADAIAAEKKAAAELEAEQQARLDAIAAEERAEARRGNRRKFLIGVITALGVAGTGILAAMAHGCS